MSRIPSTADRPIPTSEPTVATQQTSETESIKKTDIAGKTPLEAERVAKEPASTTDSKGAQYESRLGGLARESEMQSQFPIPPTLKENPALRPNLDPNVHLDEKIDLSKNLPDGMAIPKGLDGLDWGPNKAKTGPGHFGVEMTYGGMKAPTDVLAEVRNGGKPGQSNPSGPGSKLTPPPGVELSFRAPKWDQISEGEGKPLKPYVPPAEKQPPPEKTLGQKAKEWFDEKIYGKPDAGTPEPPKPIYMTDPDATGGGGIPSAGDIERIVNVHLGAVSHGVNPDLGLGNGPITAGDFKKPIDPLRDPIGGEESVELLSPEQAKLAADIHGPRTVNPNSDVGPVAKNIPVVPPSGGDTGNPAGWEP